MITQEIGQNLQQQQYIICADINCQMNRILASWTQLSDHLNERHQIITQEELINRIKNQYLDIQNQNDKYLSQFKELINMQFNQWTRSLINQIDKFIDHLYRQSEQELYNQIKQVLEQNQVIELEELDKRSASLLNQENLEYLISKFHTIDPYDQYLFEDKIRIIQDQVDIYLGDIQQKLQYMIDDEINNHILFDNNIDNKLQFRQSQNQQAQDDGYSNNNLDQSSSHSLNDQNIYSANSFQQQIQSSYPMNYYQQPEQINQNQITYFQQPEPFQQVNETQLQNPYFQQPEPIQYINEMQLQNPQSTENYPQPQASLKGYKQLQQAQNNQEYKTIQQPQQQKPLPVYSTVLNKDTSQYVVKQPECYKQDDNRQNRNNNYNQKKTVQPEKYTQILKIDKGLSDNHIKNYANGTFTCLNNSALVIFKGQITQKQSSILQIKYTVNKTSKYFMYVGVLDYNLFTRSNLRQQNMPNTYCIDDLGNGYSNKKKEKSKFKLKEKQVITVKYSNRLNQLVFDQGDFEFEIDLRIQQKNELFYFIYFSETTIDII